MRVVRVAGAKTGRIGVVVASGGGERSFVTDRGAALLLGPEDLKPDWFAGVDLLHLTVYSLLGSPLGRVGAARDRARPRGRRAGEPGPGLDRSAPGRWPSGGP